MKKAVTRRGQYQFTVVIEQDEDGRFLAICPALQGCYTEGETEEEARELIEDAVRLHLEHRLELVGQHSGKQNCEDRGT